MLRLGAGEATVHFHAIAVQGFGWVKSYVLEDKPMSMPLKTLIANGFGVVQPARSDVADQYLHSSYTIGRSQ
ncbi:MAG: hypothetical protein RIB93_11455 [Coleofasciculus sp. D1-CHI-01]|uniref:hypothetical protein n=1 Tax=Coleofasciculus sp. D1-CHI-01 TaxID=3068482 RepID=UPI0032F59944